MTSFVIRHRDQRRRERMIDEAVRRVRLNMPLRWGILSLRNACGYPLVADEDDAFLRHVRAEFSRLASR